jgi:maleylpyruvate isomerase
VAGAESGLLARVAGLTDGEAWAPSKLPDWSRAEVLTHLARNADGFRRMAEGAMRGEVAEMYPDGREGRARDIAAGRGLPAAAVVADLAQSVEWLHETWAAMPEEAWSRLGSLTGGGGTAPIAETVVRRWIEVEVHQLDLDLGASVEDWTVPFADAALPRAVERLPAWAREPVDGRWVLWADDLGRAWTVSSLAGGVSIGRFDQDDPTPDVIFRGPGGALVALVYRGRRDGVKVSGDQAMADGFSGWFPCP